MTFCRQTKTARIISRCHFLGIYIFVAVLFFSLSANAELSPFEVSRALRSLDEFKNATKVSLAYSRRGDSQTSFISIEAQYERALDKNFALIWSPLPLGVLYQLEADVDLESAVQWNLGLAAFNGLGLEPRFDSYVRKRISKTLDLELQIEYGTFVPLNEKPSIWSFGFSFYPRIHISEETSLLPGFRLITRDALLREVVKTSSRTDSREYLELTAPIFIAVETAKTDGVHYGFEYTFRGLGMTEYFFVHMIRVSAAWFW